MVVRKCGNVQANYVLDKNEWTSKKQISLDDTSHDLPDVHTALPELVEQTCSGFLARIFGREMISIFTETTSSIK